MSDDAAGWKILALKIPKRQESKLKFLPKITVLTRHVFLVRANERIRSSKQRLR
jgi:hypothetical protein